MKKSIKGLAVAIFIAAAVAVFSVSASTAATWSGGARVINKANGAVVQQLDQHHYKTTVGTNFVFVPEGMGPNAHHFTLSVKDLSTGNMVWSQYRTMMSRWSMENPTRDGTLGFTTFKTGSYWVQVEAYQADGVGAGSYYSVVDVVNNVQ